MLDAVEAVLRDLVPEHADELLDSVSFLESVQVLEGVDPDGEEFTEAVETAVDLVLDEDDEDEEADDEEDDEEDDEPAAEAFDSAAHPRAATGTATGGQFVASGSGASSSQAKTGKAAGKGKGKTGRRKRIRGESLAYNPRTGRGPGYGKRGGDARVRKLQKALNRLGLTDGRGRKLVVDGKLGPLTTQAIKAAQRKLGIKADGKVTPEFLMKLVAAKSLADVGKKPAKKAKPVALKPPEKPPPTRRVAMRREADGAADEEQTEAEDTVEGRVIEAKGVDAAGGRVFHVRIIREGVSRNRRCYPAAVLREATGLYEGAKAYDHHRTVEELRTSTINGLVGAYRNVTYTGDGLYGDLHLLPSATHTAEALDASLAAQEQGLPPLVGISHDVLAVYRPAATSGGARMQEATAITRVHSADVVADPAAGGIATRMVAGGVDDTDPEGSLPEGQSTEESDVAVTPDDVLAALQTATPEQLAAVGLSKVSESPATDPAPDGGPQPATEAADPTGVAKTSFLARLMVQDKVAAAGLPTAVTESLVEALPDRLTEADVDAQIAALKKVLGVVERSGLAPQHTAAVTRESLDKKREALDAFFAGDYAKGYRSFRQAFIDFTGYRPRSIDEDVNRVVLRESFGIGFDSSVRSLESGDTSTWAQVLGDSVTRRMVAEYANPSLSTWRAIVSSVVPVMDFRTQRVGRIGGYGTLPAVNQGAPYQPLTTPGDEEATYAITKRGGTEDVTLEMIANDDVRAIQKIPGKLGRAAAQTLYRFVWDMLVNNDTCTFDSVALFHSGSHANTDTSAALTQTTLGVGRRKMIEQAAYGDTSEVLGITPKYLIVPPELEELAFQLTTSAVAVPSTPAGPSDIPNIHQANGLTSILVPYLTDANDWFLACDPNTCPTIEVGFYNGRQEPELFTQSDPNVGSVFNSDTFTWKIRHIYSGTILDYRGFYRGQG